MLFYFLFPVLSFFIFVSSAACAFWSFFSYYYYTWATHQQSVCVCGQNMKFSYSFFSSFFAAVFISRFLHITHPHIFAEDSFCELYLYFLGREMGKEDE